MQSNKRAIARRANLCKPILVAALFSSAPLLVSPAARAQGNCKPVYDATDKLITVSSHGYQSETNPGKAGAQITNSEVIRTGGAIYISTKGKWKKSSMSLADMNAQEQENRKTAKNVSCKHLRDESVNGESSAVYSMHSETDDAKADGQVWISKSKGLLLREDEDLDVGDAGGKTHISIRYQYSNVQAPSVSR